MNACSLTYILLIPLGKVAERLLQVMKKNPGKDRPKQRKADKEDEGSDANSFGEIRCVAWETPQQAGSGNHEVYEIPDDGVDDDDLTILLDVPQDLLRSTLAVLVSGWGVLCILPGRFGFGLRLARQFYNQTLRGVCVRICQS